MIYVTSVMVTHQVDRDLVVEVTEVWDISVRSVPEQLWSDGICKWCRVVASQVDLNLVAEVTEVKIERVPDIGVDKCPCTDVKQWFMIRM